MDLGTSGSCNRRNLEEEKEDEVPSDAEAPEGDSEGKVTKRI